MFKLDIPRVLWSLYIWTLLCLFVFSPLMRSYIYKNKFGVRVLDGNTHMFLHFPSPQQIFALLSIVRFSHFCGTDYIKWVISLFVYVNPQLYFFCVTWKLWRTVNQASEQTLLADSGLYNCIKDRWNSILIPHTLMVATLVLSLNLNQLQELVNTT